MKKFVCIRAKIPLPWNKLTGDVFPFFLRTQGFFWGKRDTPRKLVYKFISSWLQPSCVSVMAYVSHCPLPGNGLTSCLSYKTSSFLNQPAGPFPFIPQMVWLSSKKLLDVFLKVRSGLTMTTNFLKFMLACACQEAYLLDCKVSEPSAKSRTQQLLNPGRHDHFRLPIKFSTCMCWNVRAEVDNKL